MSVLIAIILFLVTVMMWLVLKELYFQNENNSMIIGLLMKNYKQLHIMTHDLQQIKTRLTWSRRREHKDLKQEIKPRKKR